MTVACGLDVLLADPGDLPVKRVGLLANRAVYALSGDWILDALRASGVKPAVLFAAEHGLSLSRHEGEPVPGEGVDGLPVISLYGGPADTTLTALSELDEVLVDLQDVGARYYTYGWTVRELLRLSVQTGTAVTVLDRPNPLGGAEIEGSVPDPDFDSPVASARVPVRHGLTLGELARWHVGSGRIPTRLNVVRMKGWRRERLWPQTRLEWHPPSPALLRPSAVALYPGICLLEGTNVSLGRGTDAPFEQCGAPFVQGDDLAARLHRHPVFREVDITSVRFTPARSTFAGQECRGVRFAPRRWHGLQPVRLGLTLVQELARYDAFAFDTGHFDALAGTARWREAVQAGVDAGEIAKSWKADEELFRQERGQILLY